MGVVAVHQPVTPHTVSQELDALHDAVVLAYDQYTKQKYANSRDALYSAVKLAGRLHTRMDVLTGIEK